MAGPVDTQGITGSGAAWATALIVGAFAGSIALVGFLLVRLPATYFLDSRPRATGGSGHPVLRWAVLLAKNFAGAVLVVLGIVMLVTPGQGALTILIGIMLLDFPGKRRLERKLIGRPAVHRAINRLRARFGRPPILLDEAESDRRRADGGGAE